MGYISYISYVVVSILGILGRCSGTARVLSCSVSSMKGYNRDLSIEIDHLIHINCDTMTSDCTYYGRHDRNEICLDKDLYPLTTATCDDILDENSFISTCSGWGTCSSPKCCFLIYYTATYTATYTRILTIYIPNFTFLSSIPNIYSSNTSASYYSQSTFNGVTCDDLNAPVIMGITGIYTKCILYIIIYIDLTYSASDNTVYADTTLTIQFALDVAVPITAYYEFTFPYASQLSTFADSCSLVYHLINIIYIYRYIIYIYIYIYIYGI